MKYKSDFITNSSSTSFIIGDISGKLKSIKIIVSYDPKIEVNIFRILGYQEILEEDLEYYSDDIIREIRDIWKNNGKVYDFVASDQDSILETGLCYNGIYIADIIEKQRDKIKIIKGDGGY